MGDVQISGTAVTVIGLMLSGLAGAVVYMFKAMRSDHDRRLAELRADFKQALVDLRNDYQQRLNECQQNNSELKAYLNRQAGTVKESTELLRELSSPRPTGGL